jgi:hypothetical protein
MSKSSTSSPAEDESWNQQIQKLKEKFSTLTHEERHNEEIERDEKLKQLDIKQDEINK